MKPTCRATDDGYLVNGEHYDDCRDADCLGCWPCVPTTEHGDPMGHCTGRGRCTTHLDADVLVCPGCILRVRTSLLDIVLMTGQLPAEVIHRGVESEAANLAGPAADPAALSEQRVEQLRANDYDATKLDDEDPHHPYLVLGRWDLMLREEYGPPTTKLITVARTVAYLGTQLDRLAQDPEQDWQLFAREVNTCRTHLEAVLHNSRSPERGAPCPSCADAEPDKPAPRLTLKRADHDRTGASDTWVCPEHHEHHWTDAEYRMRVGKDFLRYSKALTARQMREAHRVKEGSVRGWAAMVTDDEEPLVRKRGKSPQGLTLYDVADTLATRDGTRKAAKRDTGLEDCVR